MARCLICGLRYSGDTPGCAHEQPPIERDSDSAEPEIDVDGLQVPGYDLHEVLGSGGFGVVVAATRCSDGRPAAVKIGYRNNQDAIARLQVEVRALREIGPPHVPELFDAGALENRVPYFACEHLDLPSLDTILAERAGPMPRDEFLALADPFLLAVRAAHERGFIHRDLKPENIFIQANPPLCRLIDFGIAKYVGEMSVELTAVGVALGTPEYMSPEQCAGRPNIDHRTDIYGAGVVLYEMATGRPPFFGAPAEVRAAHQGRRPPRPSRVADIAPTFDDVLLRCLAKDRMRRFANIDSLRLALAQAAQDASGGSPRAETSDPVAAGLRSERKPRTSKRKQLEHMGILFFHATASTGEVKRALTSLGGQLASVEGTRCVVVFGLSASDKPVQRAYDSAQTLIAQNLCARVLVDQDRVRVRKRPDGRVRVFAAALARPERFPRTTDPPGVLLTPAATDSLPDLRTVLVRDGLLREYSLHAEFAADSDATILSVGSGKLFGRDAEVDKLLRAAQDALVDKRSTIATVTSESGYGKSHLLATVLEQIQRTLPLTRVVHIRCREPIGGESNQTLQALLRATMRLPRTATARQGQDLLRARLGGDIGDELWLAVALIMGWLDADAPEVSRFRVAPSALRAAATRAAGEALRRLAATSAVCCVLDDVHFADETTLDALEYASLPDWRVPFLVLVTALPNFAKARPQWGQRATRRLEIELGSLDDASAGQLCRHLLRPADNIASETIARMVQQTQGSPLLLDELARAIKRQGLIRPRGRGDAYFLATDELEELENSPQVEWLAARELQALPSELAAHGRLVALLGPEVTVWEMEGVLGELEADGLEQQFPLDAQVSLERLKMHGMLVGHREGTYSFRHQLIRDQVAQTTSDELRTEIHRAAYRMYRDTRSLSDQGRLPRLALHAAASGLHDEAAALYLQLAEQHVYRHDYVDAELMYTRALTYLPNDATERRRRAYNGRGLMRYRLSRFEDALADLDEARSHARERGDWQAEIAIILDEATVLDWMMDYHKSKELIERARALAPDDRPPLIDARLCMGEARSHQRMGNLDEAEILFEVAADKAEALGDAGYETQVIALMMLGYTLMLKNQLERAWAPLERVIALCGARGDKLHLASVYAHCSYLWFVRRDLQRAVEYGLECRKIGREIGLSELEYLSSFNLGEYHYYAGEADAAESYVARARTMEPSNSKRPLSWLLHVRLLVFQERISEARMVLAQLAKLHEASMVATDHDAWYHDNEMILYDATRLAVSDDASEEDWMTLRERAEKGSQPEELAEVIEFSAMAAARRGDTEGARAGLLEALQVCARTSHLIEDRIKRTLQRL